MTYTISTKCTLAYATRKKRERIESILSEYSRVVNCFINQFKDNCPKKKDLLKEIVNSVDTWLQFALRQTAAREAINMLSSYQEVKKVQPNSKLPKHNGKSMSLSIGNLLFQESNNSFDRWARIKGCNGQFNIPIKLHRHFNRLQKKGKLCNSFLVTKDYIQFAFEIEVDQKLKPESDVNCVGIDLGMTSTIVASNGQFYGKDIRRILDKITRKKRGSKKQKKARRELGQYQNLAAKQFVADCVANNKSLVVMENLKGLNYKTKKKRRLHKNIRRLLGAWQYSRLMGRIKLLCDLNRVQYNTVSPHKTSITCHACGHAEYGNRQSQEKFRCLKCGHTNNADVNAARNILGRLLSGPFSPFAGTGVTEPLKNL